MPVVWLIILVVFLVTVKGCISGDDEEPATANRYFEVKALVEQSVEDALKDSDSAEFRGFFPGESNGNVMGCGEVNAKNSFGGYTGFKRYVSGGGDTVGIEGETNGFDEAWDAFCEPYVHRKP
ncbi:hypothetical protein [Vreelandella titanicae]|uniref:hypothetical protein n=1 Tax=Vreelandella titanicae TaxID=664683 RepID=UPI00241D3B56|nr:hypothetical protein [Halomonas titanicae]